VRVEFFLTEIQYLELARRISELEQGELPERKNSMIELILADGSLYPYQGKFDFVDRNVDPNTGSILTQVSFPNPEKLIRPGQFARIRTIAERVTDGILVPQRCVSELQGINRVFVVGDDNTVEERRVEVGPNLGNQRLIRDGLKAGEKVVYEGLQKVADGAVVTPETVSIEPPAKETQ
jgi:membrane fusion protein (multidrug efflux system)